MDVSKPVNLPAEQVAIWERCFHPTGEWTEFAASALDRSIVTRFEQQAAKYPDRLAAKAAGHSISYRELDQAANQVAAAILERCSPGSEPIALLMDLSIDFLIAVLGVWKAGKFYMGLDPAYPRHRQSYMLADSQARLVLTTGQLLPAARALAPDECWIMNLGDVAKSGVVKKPPIEVGPHDYANLVYTSGTTGQPKGVVDSHRNLMNCARNLTRIGHYCAEDRFSLLTPPGSSGIVHALLGALLNGASLFPFNSKEMALEKLGNWLAQEEITVMTGGAVFRAWATTMHRPMQQTSVRLIPIGAGPLYRDHVEFYRQQFDEHCVLVNLFAATEIRDFCRYYVDKQTRLSTYLVPVGYPLEGTDLFVVDEHGQRLGFGQTGEVQVHSRYLVPGYWRRPHLTQEKFLPDPEAADRRIYRMGDVGRISPDGCLTIIGRRDRQVKVRGYTVEPAEVELSLMEAPNIRDAVVVAHPDPGGDQRLVAYVSPRRAPGPDVAELRRELRTRLPEHFIPSRIMVLPTLPYNSHGKIDRPALPQPDWQRPDALGDYIAPRTPEEQILASIWSEVLGLQLVSVNHNFLDLGGHSLLATQVLARMAERFQAEFPMQLLFESPTVEALAERVQEVRLWMQAALPPFG